MASVPMLSDREEVLTHFASALDLFASSLPKSERDILGKMILAVADPLERLKHQDVAQILSDQEEALLFALESGEQGGA